MGNKHNSWIIIADETESKLNQVFMSGKKLIIGLFGFGVVGESIYRELQQTPSLNALKKFALGTVEKSAMRPKIYLLPKQVNY